MSMITYDMGHGDGLGQDLGEQEKDETYKGSLNIMSVLLDILISTVRELWTFCTLYPKKSSLFILGKLPVFLSVG